MDEGLRVLLGRRKNRVLAIMLAEKDDLAENGYLPEYEAEHLRKVILDQVNDFHDFCVDLLGTTGSMQTNQYALDRLNEIYEIVSAD